MSRTDINARRRTPISNIGDRGRLVTDYTVITREIHHQGAATTRAATALTPQCVHVVEIARAAATDDAHPKRFDPAALVIGGRLQLESIDIFLRQPIPPGERDLIICNTTLGQHVAVFWQSLRLNKANCSLFLPFLSFLSRYLV